MPHLLIPRKGWENESLAAYLLSRFSFVARPTSIADDVGSDFFCTIFETQKMSERDVLIPRNSFAIQVKSSPSEVLVENKIDYLSALELPFFIGVVSQSPPGIDVYSAELLPLLFSDIGRPDRLSLLPVAKSEFDPEKYCEHLGNKRVRLRCPLVTTFSAEDERSMLTTKVKALLEVCTRTHGNIATRLGEEHIYDLDGKGNFKIVAGSGSVNYFRMNFIKRLGEVFYNLVWIVGAGLHDKSVMAEIELFDSLYHKLENLYGPLYGRLPSYVSTPYNILKARLSGQSS